MSVSLNVIMNIFFATHKGIIPANVVIVIMAAFGMRNAVRIVSIDEEDEVDETKLTLKMMFTLLSVQIFFFGIYILSNLIQEEILAKVEVQSEFKIILNNLKESIIILSTDRDQLQKTAS